MKTHLMIALFVLLLVSAAHAERNSAQRVKAFAALPNWSGLWESDIAIALLSLSGHLQDANDGDELRYSKLISSHPPLNEKSEQQFQAMASNPAVRAAAMSGKSCNSGFPLLMDWVSMFQVVVTPEETLFVFDRSAVRHIYTDGRSHPSTDDLWPTPMGDSIGRWDGEVLVIDTIARSAGPLGIGPNAFSDQTHFTERLRRIDKNTLENQMTIDDPLQFTGLWQLTIRYKLVTDINRMIPWSCENDRNPVVDGKLTIAPP